MKTTPFILALLLLLACRKETVNPAKTPHVAKIENVAEDTFPALFSKASTLDTLVFDSYKPFVAFRSGKLFSGKEKDVLLFTTQDTGMLVEWHTLTDGRWIRNDEVHLDQFSLAQFDCTLEDYNFDGHKDIYIQRGVSNGFSLSYGHIITIDPEKKKMTSHPETENLGDMKPDKENKVIRSTEAFRCPTSMNVWDAPCILSHKWINGKLTFNEKKCPECPEAL